MNPTKIDKIIEAVKKHIPQSDYYGYTSLRAEIASVIGKEMPKIDLNEVELLVEVFAEVHGGKTETIESYWRNKIGYTLEDLTPKIKEDGTK